MSATRREQYVVKRALWVILIFISVFCVAAVSDECDGKDEVVPINQSSGTCEGIIQDPNTGEYFCVNQK